MACIHPPIAAVGRQQQSDASEARRWADEAASLKDEGTQLAAELAATKQELDQAREQLQQLQHMQSSSGRRMVELEGDAAELAQQLTVRGKDCCGGGQCMTADATAAPSPLG